MPKRMKLSFFVMLLEIITYYFLLSLFNIPYKIDFLVIYVLFQIIYKHYKDDNKLIWADNERWCHDA